MDLKIHLNIVLKQFSELSMTFDKTKVAVVWFGCEQPPNTKYLNHLHFEWKPNSFSVLGVGFTIDLKL